MTAFSDDQREAHGVEPICKVLPIAPSTYHAHVARRAHPAKRSARAKRDAALKPEVRRVFDDNFQVYGVRKVWRQLRRENHDVARCTVERLMRDMGLQGAIRGKPVRTTVSDKAAPCPLDHVNRQFRAPGPNVLWVSDFTYVATWAGFCTSPSSSTLMHGASSAGGYPGPRTRASCSTRWNKPSMTAGPCIAEASFITATEAASTSPSSTPNAWPRRASSPPWAVSAIATTTRWPRRSTASTRPKSSTGVDRGDRSRRSSSPP